MVLKNVGINIAEERKKNIYNFFTFYNRRHGPKSNLHGSNIIPNLKNFS